MSDQASAAGTTAPKSGWEGFSRAAAGAFRRYAEWLVGISWKKFFLLSLLSMIAAGILSELPPFNLEISRTEKPATASRPESQAQRAAREKVRERIRERVGDVEIKIDQSGVRILRNSNSSAKKTEPKDASTGESRETPGAEPKDAPGTGPKKAPEGEAKKGIDEGASKSPDAPHSVAGGKIVVGPLGVRIDLPPGEVNDEIRQAIGEASESIREAIEEQAGLAQDKPKVRTKIVRLGDFLPQLALLFIVASMVIKIAYAGRVKAEVKAAEAQETADAESLRRQVVEARMAAMQAQVEPHFLFNTLASIDHLIETDSRRASAMQKNLIALLRASMPGMRESETNLGRELAVVRPYLEILRVRMGERLQVEIRVGEGLNSADFPPMMLQSVVENAIKHGLEPKPEGGRLTVEAEVVHGRLEVTVVDTGVGFGRAATTGTGVGLANIRERLKLIYGGEAELRIADNAPNGTRITIVVPYRTANNTTRA